MNEIVIKKIHSEIQRLRHLVNFVGHADLSHFRHGSSSDTRSKLFVKIQCYSGVPQGCHLGPLFFITNMSDEFNIFQNVWALGFADGLKLSINVKNADDCQLFQSDLIYRSFKRVVPSKQIQPERGEM
jgi:hypothetical protein